MAKANLKHYEYVIESHVAGIPCLIAVSECNIQPGCSWADNSDDYYGYSDISYDILDSKGYHAAWLEKKISSAEDDRIVDLIIEHHTETVESYRDYD
jgi:hypothetical protein